MSVSRGCRGCLRAKARRWPVNSAPRSAASLISLAIAARCGLSATASARNIDRAGDDGEHVVEVVRDAAGQLADGFHLLGLLELFLGRNLLGDIPDKSIDDVTIAAAKRGERDFGAEIRAVAPQCDGAS